MPRPKLLYLTRMAPLIHGTGTPQRCGASLEILADSYDVHLLVVPVRDETEMPVVPEYFRERCAAVEVMNPNDSVDPDYLQSPDSYAFPKEFRFATETNLRRAAAQFAGTRFDAVYLFRLFLAPFIEAFPEGANGRPPFLALDLDDYQSRQRRSRAEAHANCNEPLLAEFHSREADRSANAESIWLPRFDQVFMAGGEERDALQRQHPEIRVARLPNVVRLPGIPPAARQPSEEPVLLFVASLEYPPNIDAAIYLVQEILPALRAASDRPWRIQIAGARPTDAVRQLAEKPGIEIIADPPTVAPLYQRADVAVVPLRSGSGTRIKILEAAAHQVPFVSTTIGAEGLEVSHEREGLIADDPQEFAAAVLRLLDDSELRSRMTQRAYQWVRRRHTLPSIREALQAAEFPQI